MAGILIYKRGTIWWYEFVFLGQRIRESTNTSNKEAAARFERARHHRLESGAVGLPEPKRPSLFTVAARKWLEEKNPHWSANTARIATTNVGHLKPHFAKLLLTDVEADDISRYQAKRKKEGASPKTINNEVDTLRAILRNHDHLLWAKLQRKVHRLKPRKDVGRALSHDEWHRLLTACRKNRSRSLYPAVLLSIHTGLRNAELRHLRWRQIDLIEAQLTVGKSKTEGGEGRVIPLSETALACLKEWRSQFPDAHPGHYVFPSERYGLKGEGEDGHFGGKVQPYEVRPTVPIGSWKTAWTTAREVAKVECRWHDMRHTFVSTMAEGKASDATIMSLAGHLSRKMMEKYSHTRNEAKRAAISVLDEARPMGSPQIPPQ
jgi:integrase